MKDWRETGKVIRERWRSCLSEHASSILAEWSRYKDVDPETLLIELPVDWLSGGFANGYDPLRFSPERVRKRAQSRIESSHYDRDDLNGRPRGEATRAAATIAHYFYDEWVRENRKRGIVDYGHRGEMRDYAAEAIVEDFFAWRFRVGVRHVFVWELGKAADVDSLIQFVRDLMDKPKKRREPGPEEEFAFPMMLKFPPKLARSR
jgi:hypothetical protein